MYEEKSLEVSRVIFLLDVVITSMTFILSIWLRKYLVPESHVDFFSHMALLPLVLLFIICFLSYFGAYEGPCHAKLFDYGRATIQSVALGIGALLTLLFIFKIDYISRAVMLSFAATETFLIFGIRVVVKRYHKTCVLQAKSTRRVIVIGTGERAKELSYNLKKQSEWGIEIIGHLDPDSSRVGTIVAGAPVIGTISDIENILKSNVVDEVIIAITRSMLADAEPIAQACEQEGIKLRFMADLFNLEVARTKLMTLGNIPILTMEPVAQDEIQLMIKRVIDLVLTIISLPLAIPLMAMISIAIKIESAGPVFFIQNRIGLKKRQFPMLKFRSMYQDAEERLKEIEHLNEAEGPIFKMKNDPRVTKVGKILRKTSLDEIPQLINVLRGEMSLVGPRPMSIRDVKLFDKGIQRKRFSVKPGITCIWQISGRSNLPFEKWLELDIEYISNWSLWLDIKILIKTMPAVLFSKGAV
jgi:exopolysaccharide biosynthesis polyprenyl glycosylphosphotransferase